MPKQKSVMDEIFERPESVMGHVFDGPDSVMGRIFDGPDSLMGRIFGSPEPTTPELQVRIRVNKQQIDRLGKGGSLSFRIPTGTITVIGEPAEAKTT
jgi:hypothetical protein